MYINESDSDQIVTKLMKLKYVKEIEGSPYKYLKSIMKRNNMNFHK